MLEGALQSPEVLRDDGDVHGRGLRRHQLPPWELANRNRPRPSSRPCATRQPGTTVHPHDLEPGRPATVTLLRGRQPPGVVDRPRTGPGRDRRPASYGDVGRRVDPVAPRLTGHHSSLGHRDRPPRLVHDIGSKRAGEDPRRGRAGDPARPRPVQWPQPDRTLAPRDARLPVGDAPATLQHRGPHRVETDHRLHPGHSPRHLLVGATAPQPVGVVGCRLDGLGQEAHPLDRGSHRPGVAPGAQPGSRRACLELPVHPVDEVARGEAAWMQPGPRRRHDTVGLRLDAYGDRDQLPIGQPLHEPLGGGADAEADRLRRLQRRLEADLAGELRRWSAGAERGRCRALRTLPDTQPEAAEPVAHLRRPRAG